MRLNIIVVLVVACVLGGCVPPEGSGPQSAPLPVESVATPPLDMPSETAADTKTPGNALPQVGTPDAPLVIAAPEDAAETHPDAPVYDASAEGADELATMAAHYSDAPPLSAKATPVEGEKRFVVTGDLKLEGMITLTDADAGSWLFEGSITFPNDGYKTGEVTLSATQTQMRPKDGQGELEVVDVVIISLPVSAPPEDAEVIVGDQRLPIKLTIQAAPDTRFAVVFTSF